MLIAAKKEHQKLKNLNFKVSEKEKQLMLEKAKEYTQGNLSLWLRYVALNYVPKEHELSK